MAAKSTIKTDEKTTINIPENNNKEKEKFVGTPKGRYLVKTKINVKVSGDVRAVCELAEMQRNARLRRVEKMRLKDPDENQQ